MASQLLTDHTVAFIQREVASDLASCSAQLRPSGCRGFACLVSPDRQRLTIHVRKSEAGQLLEDVRSQDKIAAVFCLPATEVAIQIKGSNVHLLEVDADGIASIERDRHAFVDGIVPLGHDRGFGLAYMSAEPDQMVALEFSPESVFDQTPGPKAGQAMSPQST